MPTGFIFNIQRGSWHDGPGIRTTVFLKGCPLRCRWCHNPEGLEARAQLRLAAALCTGCGRCAAACPRGVHEITAGEHRLHIEPCTACGACVAACPPAALEVVGREMAVEEVMGVVRRDAPFYATSGGGMTLSGGEPLAQHAFALALLAAAQAETIHTAVETAALAPWERLAELAPVADLFLVDLKHTDDARHRELTGVSNDLILANIRRLAATGHPFILRIPWVPTMNADPAFLAGLLAFLPSLPTRPLIEFLPYHRLGAGKWRSLGGDPAMPEEIPAADRADVEPWAERLREAGIAAKVGS